MLWEMANRPIGAEVVERGQGGVIRVRGGGDVRIKAAGGGIVFTGGGERLAEVG